MSDPVVTLRVEARVDDADPDLCSPQCVGYTQKPMNELTAHMGYRCLLFGESCEFVDQDDDTQYDQLRCPACLSAEQPAPKGKP